MHAFLISLMVLASAGILCAQTAWTTHPNTPANLTSASKLKFANDSIRLVWQSSSNFPSQAHQTDLAQAPDMPTPYVLPVNPITMGVGLAPGPPGKLTIRYATSTGEYQSIIQDGSELRIPGSSRTLVGPPQLVSGFVVVSATYGSPAIVADVKDVFRTTTISLPSFSYNFTLNDFTYDANGALLLLSGGYSPSIARPHPAGGYGSEEPSGSFPSNTRVCGTWSDGVLVMGFSTPSYSSYDEMSPLLRTSTSGSYSSSSWIAPTLAPGFSVKQVIHEDDRFVAVGTRYDTAYPYSPKGAVLTSSDGVEWTTMVIDGTTSLDAVFRDATQWVAVGDSGSVVMSPNGFEWTKSSIPGAGNLLSVACGNGYCVVGSSAGKIFASTDFSIWNQQLSSNNSVRDLAVGDGQFMALAGTQVYQAPFSPTGIADITTQPAAAFVVPGQSVTLSIAAVGSGTLGYQWYEGASGDITQPVDQATEASFATPALDSTTRYWVRVSNAVGSEDSLAATLTMQAPPVITTQPINRTFTMGVTSSTSVNVTGNNISYQWYQGFSGDISTPLAGKTSASLTVPGQQAGVRHYWVRVSNVLGSQDSASMRAEVIAVAPTITSQPLDASTYRTDYKSISVSVSGPYLSYQWYAGPTGDTSLPVSSTSSSYAPPYNTAGNYQYWVRVSNPVGSVDSRTVIFSVLPYLKPVLTRQPFDTATYVGSSESVNVTASGDDLSYAWYAGESGDTSTLLADSGSYFYPSHAAPGSYRYWVRISNPAGFVDSAGFTFLVKPLASGLIAKHPLDTTTRINLSISLTVTASGSGLGYQWYSGHSGDTSTPPPGKTSSFFNPSTSTAGQQPYWVRVTSGSTLEDSETAVVTAVPLPLGITAQPLDRGTYAGDSFYYYVYTNGSNVTYQWYSGISGDTSNPIADETSYSFDPPVSVAGEFHYWLRATSGVEHVNSRTATVTVIGRPPVITNQPQDQHFMEGADYMVISAGVAYSNGVTWQWYQGTSGDVSAPVPNQTGASLSVSTLPAGEYVFWARATNPHGIADSRTASIRVRPSQYAEWLVQHRLPEDGSGIGAPIASAYQDGVANLLKYLLGMGAGDRFDGSHGPKSGSREIGGHRYLTLEFVHFIEAQDADLVVEESTSLNTWTTTAIECGPSYDNGDNTRTRTFRSSQPMDTASSGYLRLKASSD